MASKAKKFSPDYTAEDILALWRVKSTDGDESRRRGLIATFRTLCRMGHSIDVPEGYKKITKVVKTPFARDAYHRISASMVQKPPLVHIEPKDEKRKEYRDAASIGERWDQAIIERMNKERGGDIFWELTSQLIRDGESVLKVAHRPDSWANYPTRQADQDADSYNAEADDYKHGADLPIAWRDVDRTCCLFEDGEYGDEWVLEYGEYAKPYLAARYGLTYDRESQQLINPKAQLSGRGYAEDTLSTQGPRTIKYEFLTSREWHVIVDGAEAPGFPKPNPYGELNYFRAKAPDSESLLYSLMFLVPGLDRLLTMKQAAAYLYAFQTPVVEQVPNAQGLGVEWPLGEDGLPVKFTLKTGKLLQLPLGWQIKFLAPQAAGEDLNEMIGIYRALIDVAGIPSVFRGVGDPSGSGYNTSQLMQATQVAYQVARLSLQRQAERGIEFTHRLIPSLIKQTVYAYGWDSVNRKTGKPTSRASRAWLGLTDRSPGGANLAPVKLLGPVTVTYRPTLPTDLQALAMVYNQLVNSPRPLMDRRHALERMQEEDPDSILDAIYVDEAIDQDPTLKATVTQHALADAGMAPPGSAAGAPNPAAALVGPTGQPLIPGGQQGVPGQAATAIPSVPGLNMPLRPTPPAPRGVSPGQGGRVAGTYPGQPGGPRQ